MEVLNFFKVFLIFYEKHSIIIVFKTQDFYTIFHKYKNVNFIKN
ncbi:hypothetical protein HMPREF3229_00711 [Peptoniphilus harei]|uniref:Uncharacterized protein n=1 Tax=Peptoniphilus harei TaxID=54005 RepID=A0A133PQD0_9FIRM|nr:hypothetical protein HMPREF3229_00711 [Peptoniphilus harei]